MGMVYTGIQTKKEEKPKHLHDYGRKTKRQTYVETSRVLLAKTVDATDQSHPMMT